MGQYVLVGEMVVRRITRKWRTYRYGAFRAWADADHTRCFDPVQGPNFKPIVRSLSVRTEASMLAQAFQDDSAVRLLGPVDTETLRAFGRYLPTLNRVGFYAEDVLEAFLTGEGLSGRVAPSDPASRIEQRYGVPRDRSRVVREPAPTVVNFRDLTDPTMF